jgi:uncharacterized membrane protein
MSQRKQEEIMKIVISIIVIIIIGFTAVIRNASDKKQETPTQVNSVESFKK